MKSKSAILTTPLLGGLMCSLLLACTSTDSPRLTRSSDSYPPPAASTASTTSAMPGSTGNMDTANPASTVGDSSYTGMNISSATVQSIESVPRSMDQGSGDMQTGTSGTGGTGGAAANNMLYRVTLKLDDGSTRTFLQNTQPGFQIGDRVSVQKGVLQRY